METTRQELEQQLLEARKTWQALYQLPGALHASLLETLAAAERIREAESALAAFLGDQYVVPLDLGFHPDSGVSAPLLLQTESSAILTFSAMTNFVADSLSKEGTAIVEFDSCYWSTFGYPNDEALRGHPLWGRGLSAYEIFDVYNSHWARRMTEQNRVAFPDTKDSNTRHLIFTFHDSTLECLCEGIKSATLSTGPFDEVFSEISRRGLERYDGWRHFPKKE
jgi:hypothetical protein